MNNKEFFDIFYEGVEEEISSLSANLIKLQKDPYNQETLRNLREITRTLREGAEIIQLEDVAEIVAKMENTFQDVSQGTPLTAEMFSQMFSLLNKLVAILEDIQIDMGPPLEESLEESLEIALPEETAEEHPTKTAQDEGKQFTEVFSEEAQEQINEMYQGLVELRENCDDFALLQQLEESAQILKEGADILQLREVSLTLASMQQVFRQAAEREIQLERQDVGDLLRHLQQIVVFLNDANETHGNIHIRDLVEEVDDTPEQAAEPQMDWQHFLAIFAEEVGEQLQLLTEGLPKLRERDDEEFGAELMRAAHSIKGGAKMLNQIDIARHAESMEELLREFQAGKSLVENDFATLRRDLQKIKEILGEDVDASQPAETELGEGEPVAEKEIFAEETKQDIISIESPSLPTFTMHEGSINAMAESIDELSVSQQQDYRKIFTTEAQEVLTRLNRDLVSLEKQRDNAELLHRLMREIHTVKGEARLLSFAEIADATHQMEDILNDAIQRCCIEKAELEELFALIDVVATCIGEEEQTIEGEQDYVRVPTQFLDSLVNQIGEALIHLLELQKRNETLLQLPKSLRAKISEQQNPAGLIDAMQYTATAQQQILGQLELALNGLQEETIHKRMFPLAEIVHSYHRAVRDLAENLGKEVELKIRGAEVRLDKKILDEIGPVLLHCLRNALDHGVEEPEERIAAGKPACAELVIAAHSEGGRVFLEIADDGRGIDAQKIKEKILRQGLLSAEEVNTYDEQKLLEAIFMPGFSTTDFITDTSGRGFGMDIVKSTVENLRGNIQLKTEVGRGTKFTIELPTALAFQRVLIIQCCGRLFAFASNYIQHTYRIDPQKVIEVVDKKAIRIEEQIIPICPLAEVLSYPGNFVGQGKYLITVATLTETVGVIVDDIIVEREVTIKPLPKAIAKNSKLVVGYTSEGEELVLIGNLPEIIKRMRGVRWRKRGERIKPRRRQRVLVVDDSAPTREIEKSILAAGGYIVEEARNGIEGVEKALASDFDLIVSDLEMPHMHGFEMIAKLRASDKCRNIPIIIVSSRNSTDDRQRGGEVGANAYIVKSAFSQGNLLSTVEQLIGG